MESVPIYSDAIDHQTVQTQQVDELVPPKAAVSAQKSKRMGNLVSRHAKSADVPPAGGETSHALNGSVADGQMSAHQEQEPDCETYFDVDDGYQEPQGNVEVDVADNENQEPQGNAGVDVADDNQETQKSADVDGASVEETPMDVDVVDKNISGGDAPGLQIGGGVASSTPELAAVVSNTQGGPRVRRQKASMSKYVDEFRSNLMLLLHNMYQDKGLPLLKLESEYFKYFQDELNLSSFLKFFCMKIPESAPRIGLTVAESKRETILAKILSVEPFTKYFEVLSDPVLNEEKPVYRRVVCTRARSGLEMRIIAKLASQSNMSLVKREAFDMVDLTDDNTSAKYENVQYIENSVSAVNRDVDVPNAINLDSQVEAMEKSRKGDSAADAVSVDACTNEQEHEETPDRSVSGTPLSQTTDTMISRRSSARRKKPIERYGNALYLEVGKKRRYKKRMESQADTEDISKDIENTKNEEEIGQSDTDLGSSISKTPKKRKLAMPDGQTDSTPITDEIHNDIPQLNAAITCDEEQRQEIQSMPKLSVQEAHGSIPLFKKRDILTNHLGQVRVFTYTDTLHTCRLCGDKFNDEKLFISHMKPSKNFLSCDSCEAPFPSRCTLTSHHRKKECRIYQKGNPSTSGSSNPKACNADAPSGTAGNKQNVECVDLTVEDS